MFLRKDEVWLYCCLAFRKTVSDIMRVTKESLHLRGNVWTLDLIISSGHNVFSPSSFESSSWWNPTHKMCCLFPWQFIKKSQPIFPWSFVIWEAKWQCLWSANQYLVTGLQGHGYYPVLKRHIHEKVFSKAAV